MLWMLLLPYSGSQFVQQKPARRVACGMLKHWGKTDSLQSMPYLEGLRSALLAFLALLSCFALLLPCCCLAFASASDRPRGAGIAGDIWELKPFFHEFPRMRPVRPILQGA